MRDIAPAIIAAAQILIGFFCLLTLIMVSQHMVSPVLMPDAHVGTTWTLFQCMIPGLLVSGVGGSLALVCFTLGYVAQYIVAPRVILWWRARTLGEYTPISMQEAFPGREITLMVPNVVPQEERR